MLCPDTQATAQSTCDGCVQPCVTYTFKAMAPVAQRPLPAASTNACRARPPAPPDAEAITAACEA